jgi:hypothetical protein
MLGGYELATGETYAIGRQDKIALYKSERSSI